MTSLGLDSRRRSSTPRRSPGSATAASAGWPPATWTRSPRSSSPPSATASATSSASSIRTIRDGWQVEVTDKWLRYGNPWEIARPEIGLRRAVRRPHRALPRRAGPLSRALGARARRQGRAYDTPILGYGVNTSTCSGCGRPRRVESFDSRRPSIVGDYYGAVERQGARRENITKVLYPNDEPGRARQLRLEQQYFFVSCSLQDMIRLTLRDRAAARALPREVRGPAERHAPGARGRRADAPARRRARLRLGRGVGDHAAQRSPTRTTRCCPRRSRPGRCRCSAACCRATSRSSTRSTALPRRGARALPGRRRARRAHVADRRGTATARRAHGPPRDCVGSHTINGVAALHSSSCKQTVLQRLRRALAREVQQHDQRRDAAALRRAGEPGARAR